MLDDLDYLRTAYRYAEEFSPDPSTQNGAILVTPRGDVLMSGCNAFPEGVLNKPERWERPLKYQYVEHAERDVIFNAGNEGIKTKGLIMYCPWFACADCARAIIAAGIVEVVGHDLAIHKSQTHWEESFEIADQMLTEAGVRFRRVPGKIGNVKIRFAGKIVEP